MTMATITSKGQLTLPKDVRDQLGLKPGDRVDVRVDPDGTARLLPALKVEDLFGILSAYKKEWPVTPEEMDKGIEEYFHKKYSRRRKA